MTLDDTDGTGDKPAPPDDADDDDDSARGTTMSEKADKRGGEVVGVVEPRVDSTDSDSLTRGEVEECRRVLVDPDADIPLSRFVFSFFFLAAPGSRVTATATPGRKKGTLL
jgi:hypothetical protein